jgi:hypothetical protein
MCNACHNMCCGSDEFGGCGCDFCDEPDCWSDDEDLYGDDDDYFDGGDLYGCGCARPSAFRCEAVP